MAHAIKSSTATASAANDSKRARQRSLQKRHHAGAKAGVRRDLPDSALITLVSCAGLADARSICEPADDGDDVRVAIVVDT